MRILAIGGGSGGHVTPIVAVLSALRAEDASIEMEVWCDKPFFAQTVDKLRAIDASIPVRTVTSGKLRRYHTLPLWRQLLRLRTIVFPNVVDSIKIAIGIAQSYMRLRRQCPDVIFCKGGFVSLPVGIAAKWLSIPVVLHDSDAHPGLTNRVLSKSATFIGTGAPVDNYTYPSEKVRYVGVPIDQRYTLTSPEQKSHAKEAIKFETDRPLIVITGGGLGSKVINNAVLAIIDDLLRTCNVFLLSGSANYEAIKREAARRDSTRFRIEPFVGAQMVETLQAADVVVARAGATTLLELAALGKPTVIVPNPYLTGGHQIKNAAVYEEAHAAHVVEETLMVAQPHALLDAITAIVLNPGEMNRMSDAMHAFARPEAARDMASLILEAVR